MRNIGQRKHKHEEYTILERSSSSDITKCHNRDHDNSSLSLERKGRRDYM